MQIPDTATKKEKVSEILHDLEKFQYYCFIYEVNMITDHKLPAAIFKKDVGNLSHRLQRLLLLYCYPLQISCLDPNSKQR